MSANGNPSLRLFYALWPDDATRERLAALQAHVKGKLTRYDNLHITLAFLGEQPGELLPALRAILDRLARRDIVLTLDRLGYFRRKRIAWAGPHVLPDALNELVRDLTQELIDNGTAFDQRAEFKPHATLARDADAPPDFEFEPIVWHADRIVLVQSATRPDGVHYEVLAEQAPRVRDEA
jgi:RNA 2',3'-cyclic 3'-phosphodiesterase